MFMMVSVPATVLAARITLAWDASSKPKVAGYRIYYSRERGRYKKQQSVKVGKVTAYTLNLPAGQWYFVVTAYDSKGQESGYSKSVSWPSQAVPGGNESKTKAGTSPAPGAAPVSQDTAKPAENTSRGLIAPNRSHLQPSERQMNHSASRKLIEPSVRYQNLK